MEIDLTSQTQANIEPCECGTCGEEECSCPCHHEKNELATQEELIAYSVAVIELFEQKIKAHNKTYPGNKVSINDLKKVFMQTIRSGHSDSDISLVELGLAGVNSFLNLKAGNYGAYKTEYSLTLPRESLNVYARVVATDEDFEQSRKDIKDSGLDISMAKSAEDFYMDTPDQVSGITIEY